MIRNENNRNYNFFLFKISWILIILYRNSWDILEYNFSIKFILIFIAIYYKWHSYFDDRKNGNCKYF